MIRICIVDDHPVFRKGLIMLLEQEKSFEVVGDCAGAAEAASLIDKTKPDVVLLDISLKGMNGIEFTKILKESHPSVLVLIITMHDEAVYADRAMKAGARGYVLKQEAGRKIRDAIIEVNRGMLYLSDSMKDRLLDEYLDPSEDTAAKNVTTRLNDKEFNIFQYIGQGMGNTDIGVQLCMSTKTIETYKRNIMQKLGIETSRELRKYAISWCRNNMPE